MILGAISTCGGASSYLLVAGRHFHSAGSHFQIVAGQRFSTWLSAIIERDLQLPVLASPAVTARLATGRSLDRRTVQKSDLLCYRCLIGSYGSEDIVRVSAI